MTADQVDRGPVRPPRRRPPGWTTALVVVGVAAVLGGGAYLGYAVVQDGSGSRPSERGPAATTQNSGLQLDCAAAPSRCGLPDATNTGVPPGTTLVQVPEQATSGPGWTWDTRGFVSITADGTAFDGFDVQGVIDVDGADRVTIRNSMITQGGETFGIALRHTKGVSVDHVTITAPDGGDQRLLVAVKDIYGDATETTVRGTDISRAGTGIQLHEGLIENNYIHDLGFKEGDHVNGTTTNGGTGVLVIRHNTVLNKYSQTDAISLFQDFGPRANVTIEGNLVAGGSYSIYAGANPGKEATATNIKVADNRFSRLYFPQGGDFGPYTAYSSGGGNVFTGNVWDDTGLPVA